ncbi:conserved hypothetical protein [Bradyrhizobium sp. STM 3843]|uniref:tetratricopeptide repeat protein n=1 Tax=Bradyrhizobium sp. STM 3843 TaxID=551947 RepID=UPI000240A3F9|nr:tetratricopeptide repeat protein [Bradyrhizobium sp. STM 3843]CCE04224.1 conserved hypothetical protein [Bradyrhizobium sp. STM 3843]
MVAAALDLMLREAAQHYNSGRPDSADTLCGEILELRPNYLPALHLAAVLALSAGRIAQGTDLLGRVFSLDPDHVPALVTLGDALAVQGQRDGAVAAFRRAVMLRPLDVALQAKLGAALVDAARFAEAASTYQAALARDPTQVQMRFNLAVCLAADGRLAEAEQAYRTVVARDPAHKAAWLRLGNLLADRYDVDAAIAICHEGLSANPNEPSLHVAMAACLYRCGRRDDAIGHYRKVTELAPEDAATLRKLGLLLHEAGRTKDAVEIYRRCAALNSTDAEIHNHLCVCLTELGQLDGARASAERALQINPGYAKAYNNLGIVLKRQDKIEAAIACHRHAIAADPDDADGYANLAVALHQKGELDEALTAARHAVSRAPEHPLVHANLAGLLHGRGDLDGALAASHRAVALAPENPILHTNLAGLLHSKGDIDAALATSRHAVALGPEHPLVRYNHSHLLLLCGDLQNGFADYRWRSRCAEHSVSVTGPEWQGEPFAGRTLLIFAEQGLGDTLQFIRYLPMVAAKGGAIVLQVQPPLVPLLRALPDVTVVAQGAPLPPVDLQVALMDLAHVFRTTLDSIPADTPFLKADPDQVETWRRAVGDVTGLKVGVVWAGSTVHKSDRYRSLAAQALLPRLVMPGVQLYSLQKEPRSADLPVLAALGSAVIDLAPGLNDFSDTAAAVAALDLVISVDTSLAHLAGAMGRPAWVLLPYAQDWRWLRHREDSPWYRSLRLFRQKRPLIWDDVLPRVTAELQRLATTPNAES